MDEVTEDKKKYQFEMGKCDPINNHFDHHMSCNKKNTHTMKMSVVQLIEKLMICGEIKSFDVEDVEFNHLGHIDDILMAAIPFAEKNGRIRNLYKFACVASAYDSLGPIAKELLMNERDQMTLTVIQEGYAELIEEVQRANNTQGYGDDELHKVPIKLHQKWKCVKNTVPIFMSRIPRDDRGKKYIPELPTECEIVKEEEGVLLIKGYHNPYLASPYFMKEHKDVLAIIFYKDQSNMPGRHSYHIFSKSAYHANLSGLWNALQRKELIPEKFKRESWGGHPGAGGSPRRCGSCYHPDTVMQFVVHEVTKGQ